MSDTDLDYCVGCGEQEGNIHKPGCERYTSSPIVQSKDTPSGQQILQAEEQAQLDHDPEQVQREGAERYRRRVGLDVPAKKPPFTSSHAVSDLEGNVTSSHGDSSSQVEVPDEPLRFDPQKVAAEEAQAARAKRLSPRTTDAAVEVAAFREHHKLPEPGEQDLPTPLTGAGPWDVRAFQRGPQAKDTADQIQEFLNGERAYALQQVVPLASGAVLVIGKRYGPRRES